VSNPTQASPSNTAADDEDGEYTAEEREMVRLAEEQRQKMQQELF